MNPDDELGLTMSDSSTRLTYVEIAVATVFTIAAVAIRTRIPMKIALNSLSNRKSVNRTSGL